MSKVRIEAFVSVPPCSGGVAVKRLLEEVEAEFGDQGGAKEHSGYNSYSVHRCERDVPDRECFPSAHE